MSKFHDKHGVGRDDSLSAFLDNEATQADIEALLASDINVLADKLDHYAQIQQAIQPDHAVLIEDSGAFLAQMHSKLEQGKAETNVVAFPNQPSQATPPAKLEQLELPHMSPTAHRSRRSLFSGLAVAASVAFVVVLGGNLLLQGDSNNTTPTFAASTAPQATPVEPITALSPEEALQNNERLQNYLRQHAQQASMTAGQGMIPMAKVVGYPQGNGQ
ncbi:hypothetical protein MAQ5080_01059 [Marinomonas aquimarina]|uniref:Anti sigma-E protein RseA N-terminal domain-containing protein n=1 Tax=Marinomonas aquimarina TaxID=295068 RepID=A0A1A8TA06_9GAMM|nr:hypothetical protein [Marinomonas aquimarina]SBS28270.1 hypothetical protein MAQ5080_01059 [Marinomonas aquimarina]